MTKKNVFDFDFGMDFAHDLSEEVSAKDEQLSKAQDKAEAMYNMIMPLQLLSYILI